jgi:TldD protein
MLHAPECPAGVMPVVIDNGFGGVIFHEACGHSLEATSVAFGMSVFCDKLSQKIAADCVTAIDDGTLPNEWGSLRVDDEGMPTNRLVLIENGILKNYMIDKLNAKRMKMPPTGSGRRQSYALAPTSRMRNTYIAAGNDDEAAMIATMGDGLYAKKLGGGSVDPATGIFNFAVSEGYLVKDGKIVSPVRGASLIGKGADILLQIDRVGRDMKMAQGMCGSISGSIPVNVGQPMIRVKQMTVGGRA